MVSLAGLVVSLLLVGVVSGTPLRHVVQVLPACLAGVLVLLRISWSGFAAAPIFLLWFSLMAQIWLFLLGLPSMFGGHFSPAEIALTISIAGFALFGIFQMFRNKSPANWLVRLAAFLFFAALQVAAIWFSLRPAIAKR